MNDRVTLDGLHAIKHAIRFGADIFDIVSIDADQAIRLAEQFAPDITPTLRKHLTEIHRSAFENQFGPIHPTGVAATARRPPSNLGILQNEMGKPTPTIFLENPRRMNNIGAVIRVAAATDVSAVLTSGEADPWNRAAIRGSAGLHFVQPVINIQRVQVLKDLGRPIYSFDAGGTNIRSIDIPPGAILAFGTERDGISKELRSHSYAVVSLPMSTGVSSLNLATSVSAVMYYLTLQ